MTQEMTAESQTEQPQRRGRGSPKPYPTLRLEAVLDLPRAILEHGVGGQMRRLTLFDRLKRSPDSSASRQLITNSGRYGLTTGGYQAEHITITDLGAEISGIETLNSSARSKLFSCGIERFELLAKIYENLRGRRLPADDVIYDEIKKIDSSLSHSDLQQAAEIFVANVRYIGLVREVSGSARLISIEQLLEESGEDSGEIEIAEQTPTGVAVSVQPGPSELPPAPIATPSLRQPSVHIDVQIHIDSSATTEQIDQIFASMARHLYGREG